MKLQHCLWRRPFAICSPGRWTMTTWRDWNIEPGGAGTKGTNQPEIRIYIYMGIWWGYSGNICIYIYVIYIYPRGLGFSDGEVVGWGWGGACYRHVHVTLMLRWWEGWGGVGWGMLPSCSCYVDATHAASRVYDVYIHIWCIYWCFWPSGSIAGLPRSSVEKVKKNVSPLLRACCWLNIQCSQCTI